MTAPAAPAPAASWSAARGGRPGWSGAFGSEWVKLSRQRATWVLLAGFVLGFGAVCVVLATNGPNRPTERLPVPFFDSALVGFSAVFQLSSGIVLLLVASRLLGMEFTAGTVRILLGRGEGRLHLYFSKAFVLAVLGLGLLGFYLVAGGIFTTVLARVAGHAPSPSSLPARWWTDLRLSIAVQLISIGVCILVGLAGAAIGRSLAFATAFAMGFFTIDNFGTIALSLISSITHNAHWAQISDYLLGPNLNVLLRTLQTVPRAGEVFVPPADPPSAAHSLVVIAAWAAALLVAAVLAIVSRDVLE